MGTLQYCRDVVMLQYCGDTAILLYCGDTVIRVKTEESDHFSLWDANINNLVMLAVFHLSHLSCRALPWETGCRVTR